VRAALAALLAAAAIAGVAIATNAASAARDPLPVARPDVSSAPDRPPAQSARKAKRPHVVIVLFDALATHLLVDGNRHIDAVRFPHFAEFAHSATWYRNATTVSESTRFSVPAMLDGRAPRPQVPETLKGHPRNLFTILRSSYRFNVHEEATLLCPCRPASNASVLELLRHGRASRFQRAVAELSAGSRPQLTFIHTLLPHEPRTYLPDGRTYQSGTAGDSLGGPPSIDHRFLTEQVQQRTLLQLEFTDHLLGKLIARLKRKGMWDNAIVALMADHGESFKVKKTPAPPFKPGQLSFRRYATYRNLEDLGAITMIVKYPHQRHGKIDDRWVRNIDLLPTILRLTRVPRPPGLIGHNLRNRRYRGHKVVAVAKQEGRILTMSTKRFKRRFVMATRRALALYGSGSRSLYDFGPAPSLLRTPVSELVVAPRGKLKATLVQTRELAAVDLKSSFIPAQVYGRLHGGPPSGHTLAFALNGTIVATATSFKSPRGAKVNWAVMLPPNAFRQGANHLEIFKVLSNGHVQRL
jgi:Sulfatase